MAGLEALASSIYHEKQQSGSMLCAQHALNSLLQGHYFTAPDLSDIAKGLDTLEETYDDDHGQTSTNMDDTGFFSVQVLENALNVWGLNLVRWRSEAMRPYHDHPHTQLGFILNLEQHWFTLRRFGPAVANIDLDTGEGHWFNLNSFLKTPEWVGKLYLGMVLQQAEAEGYSVFAVTQIDPEAPLALPRVLADQVAATLPEPTSSGLSANTPFRRTMTSDPSSAQPDASQPQADSDNFDEEDYELQAALQASLTAHRPDAEDGDDDDDDDVVQNPPPHPFPEAQSISALGSLPRNWGPSSAQAPEAEPSDPIAASMQRSQQELLRMQREQEYAQRELWSDTNLSPEEAAALQVRRERRRIEEEQEQEELRRAIEESERLANEHRSKRARLSDSDEEDGDDEDVQMTPASPTIPPPVIASGGHYSPSRVYDDEDAELQAALKASLESTPPDWEAPELRYPPPAVHPSSSAASIPSADIETPSTKASGAGEEEEVQPIAEPLSVEEIRRRRLARFGL